jgi:putative salt-induced outer membrane protein YdiY
LISSDVLEIISNFVGNRNVMRVELRKVVHTKASSVSIGQYIKLVWLMGSLLLSTSIYSQTIINAEKLNSAKDSLAFSLQLSYSGNRGNAVTDKFKLAPSFLLVGKKNDLKLFGGYSVLATGNKSYLNNGFAHIRHNYKLSTRLKTFEFYQLQFNAVLLLQKREVFGAGLRYALVQKDSLKFDMGIGAMHESEFLDDESLEVGEITNTFVVRATVVSSFEWIMNEFVQINNVIYYQPYFKDFEDFRLLNDFSLTARITNRFNVSTSLTIRYDSKPPLALTNFDSKVNVGLGYRFSK